MLLLVRDGERGHVVGADGEEEEGFGQHVVRRGGAQGRYHLSPGHAEVAHLLRQRDVRAGELHIHRRQCMKIS